jgi:hypothetical protein
MNIDPNSSQRSFTNHEPGAAERVRDLPIIIDKILGLRLAPAT